MLTGFGPLIGTYAPVRFVRDSHCAMAGVETRWTDDLEAFEAPVLVYSEGLGFGPMMVDTAARFTGADVTLQIHETFGESDGYFHRDWEHVFAAPLLDWLARVDFH